MLHCKQAASPNLKTKVMTGSSPMLNLNCGVNCDVGADFREPEVSGSSSLGGEDGDRPMSR